ncbi:hypothetical protein [Hymenobacter sp. CRA2]|uniref:hypothetical protein n=1 Tax=Hymenobacter sp. CRA2 TaxID=1955620 RepID=UPI00098F2C52|nr:hypothetical protein [Hymenobacter sp. CRA2]OON68564.1 hypothetical protein B0919_13065 [Hymenobacter sp. CRA2]
MPVHRACLLLLTVLLCGGAACTRSPGVMERDAPPLRPSRAHQLNIAALVGRNIDQLRRELGPAKESHSSAAEPGAEQLRTVQAKDWVNTFEKSGLTIVVTFDARTREVRDLMLPGSNEDELVRRAGLDLVADKYLVLPVTDPAAPSRVLGVRVVAR